MQLLDVAGNMKFGALADLSLELPGTRMWDKLNATTFATLSPHDQCALHGFVSPGARACFSSVYDTCSNGNLSAHSCETWSIFITGACGSTAQHIPPMCGQTLSSARLRL